MSQTNAEGVFNSAEQMIDMWHDAQKTMLEGFMKAAQTTSANPIMPASMQENLNQAQSSMQASISALTDVQRTALQQSLELFQKTSDQWQSLVQAQLKGQLEHWQTQLTQPLPSSIGEQIQNTQAAMTRYWQLTSEAWQRMLTSPGQNWEDALNNYTQQLQEQLQATLNQQQQIMQNSLSFWENFMTGQPFNALWNGASQTPLAPNLSDPIQASRQASQVFAKTYQQTLMPFLESPTLGMTREFERKVRDVLGAGVENAQATYDYQMAMLDISMKAYSAVLQALAEKASRGEVIRSSTELFNLWVNVSDEVFLKEFYSQDYIGLQGALLNSTMNLTLKQRAIQESLLEAQGLPTRTELEETHEVIQELRREVRALKRELKHLRKDNVLSATVAAPASEADSEAETDSEATWHAGDHDDLQQLHGIGPKLEQQLIDQGITSYAQISEWTEATIDTFEASLTPHQSRLVRAYWQQWREEARAHLEA